MTERKTPKSGYELELAIDAKSEFAAIELLSKVFGEHVKKDILIKDFGKYGDLFFVKHRFSIDQLSDKNYEELNKSANILVISDQLSIKRASKLLEICLPVEVQLKKLLSYVYPEIIQILDGKCDKKTRIKLCKQINSLTLGDLLERLSIDMTARKREEIFISNGTKFTEILDSSMSFTDFKEKLLPQIRPNTVWDQVCTVLEKPVSYDALKKELGSLRFLRNKAAHPQIIFDNDIKIAKKYAKFVMDHIGAVKNNYKEELLKSMKTLSKTMSDLVYNCNPRLKEILKCSFSAPPAVLESIGKISTSLSAPNPALSFAKTMDNIDWLTFDSDMRKFDPEFDEIMRQFERNDASGAIDNMNNELAKINGESSNKSINNKT